MRTLRKPLLSLRAADLMSDDVVLIPREMSIQAAARILDRAQVTGAPVVDDDGRCVGVLSASDFMHRAENCEDRVGKRDIECMCSVWQIVEKDEACRDCVQQMMTCAPVTVSPTAWIGELSLMMLDAHIHRIVVVDHECKPVGIVSATDILAAVHREYQYAQHRQGVGADNLQKVNP